MNGVGPALAVAAAMTLGATLIVAALAKVRSGHGALAADLAGIGLPAPRALAVALVGSELALGAVLLVTPPVAPGATAVGAIGAALLVGAFTGYVVVAGRRGQPCPCFGAGGHDAVGPATVVRNAWLLALAVLATGPVEGAPVDGTLAFVLLLGVVTVLAVRWAARPISPARRAGP